MNDPIAPPVAPSYDPNGLSPVDQLRMSLINAKQQPDPLSAYVPAPTPDPSTIGSLKMTIPFGPTVNAPPILKNFLRAAQTQSVVGGVTLDALPYAILQTTAGSEIDPQWDVKKYATNDWLAQNPFMLQHFVSGVADDFPNERRFLNFVDRQRQDYHARERLGEVGMAGQFALGIAAQSMDFALLGAAGEAAGLAPTMQAAGKAISSGGVAARIGKGALAGAGTNLIQEEALRAINPQRNVNENEAAIMAASMGVVFGGAIPFLAHGAKSSRLGDTITTTRVKRVQKMVAETMKAPEVAAIENMGKADAEAIANIAKEMEADPTLKPVQSPAVTGVDVAATPVPPSVNEPDRLWSQASIRERLVKIHQDAPDYQPADRVLSPDGSVQSGGMGDFKGSLPEEVKHAIEKNPELRKMVRVSDRVFGTGGRDYIAEHGMDKWVSVMLELAQNDARQALEWAPKSNDPEAHFLAALDRNLPERGSRVKQTMLLPTDLAEGMRFNIHGEPMEVRATPFGDLELTSPNGAYPDVPVSMLQGIPADKGSLRFPNEQIRAMGAADPSIGGNVDAAGNTGKRQFTILDTPETRPQIEALKAKYGDMVEFLPHPQQDHYDWAMQLKDLEKTANMAMPADLGPVRNAIAGTLSRGIPIKQMESPGFTISRSPSSVARRFGRSLIEMVHPTQESVDAPVTAKAVAPAEALRWNMQAKADEALMGFRKAYTDGLREGPFSYTTSSGEKLDFGGIGSRLMGRPAFERAVQDYMWRENMFKRGVGEAVDAPKPIAQAAEHIRQFYEHMAVELKDAGLLTTGTDDLFHSPRRWLTDQVQLHTTEVKRRLIAQQEKYRTIEFNGGQPIRPETRPLIEEVMDIGKRTGQKDGRGLIPADIEAIDALAKRLERKATELTEGDIARAVGQETLKRYLEEVRLYHEGRANAFVENLIMPENSHGVEDAMGGLPGVLKRRSMQIDETAFPEFLDNQAERTMQHYERATGGRAAIRQAIKNEADFYAPIVKELTGKDLAKEGYNPALVIDAIKRDFQRWIDANQAPENAKAQLKLQEAMKRSEDIFNAKIAELEGRPVFPGNPAAQAGWKLWTERQALRLPYMAQLGKLLISAFCDTAAMSFYNRLSPERWSSTIKALNLFREVPRKHLEAFHVALADATRSIRMQELGDIRDLPDSRPFGHGFTGAMLQRSDAATKYMADKFTMLTGINRWNTNMKRTAALSVMTEMIDGARKMAKASEFVKGGMPEAEAIRRAGLSSEDALRLNRLGLNGERSAKLMEHLDQHGLDWEGNRVDSNHKGFIAPELHAMADKDLFNTFTRAVNSEVMNIIVEPTLGSRPLSNASFLGRLINQFQSFAQAWGNQHVPMAMQRPGHEIATGVSLAVGLGALTDALHNSLSGRRTLDKTIQEWQDRPFGMLYGAVNRSGIVGWLGRPLGLLEQTPIGPGKLLGNDQVSTMYARPMTLTGQLGPFFSWADNLSRGSTNYLFNGTWDDQTKRQLWNAMPFHNLIQVEGLNRISEGAGFGTFIGPEPRQR